MRVSGLMAILLAAALAACGGGGSDGDAPPSGDPSTSTPSTPSQPGPATPPDPTASSPDPTPQPPAASGISVVQRNVVQFDIENDFDNKSVWVLPAPVQPGNTLVIGFTPTLGEATITSVVDNMGNTYTHDLVSGNVHLFHLANISNGPSTITATANMPLSTRLYAWEVSGLGANPLVSTVLTPFTDSEAASASLDADGPVFLAAVVGTWPSRTPSADNGATLHRLQYLTGSNAPYSGPVSEHALHRIDTDSGSHVMGSSWLGQGASSGHVGMIALRPAPQP